MKHILLSLLTIVLAFTATTASAALTYDVVKSGYDAYHIPQDGDYRDSYYKIVITGGSGDLYITDWISGAGDNYNRSSIENEGATKYGYYLLETQDAEKADAVGKKVEMSLADNRRVFETHKWENGKVITRYGYKLGTFSEGDVLEIYMGNEVDGSRSNTTAYKGAFQKDTHADAAVMHDLGWTGEGTFWDAPNDIRMAAIKAMPLAELAFKGDGVITQGETRVHFGILEGSFGAPLPGGIPLVLVSCLFALGFWFFRRKKAVAA